MQFFTSLLLIFVLAACGDLEPKSKNNRVNTTPASQSVGDSDSSDVEAGTNDDLGDDLAGDGEVILASSLTFTDSLFSDYKWYAYNLLNHRVYPLFDVYAIRSGSGLLYKVQIIDYYSKVNHQQSGHYELRVQGPDGVTQKLAVSAEGCGDPVGGVVPDCDQENSYAFISLDTQVVAKMTLEQAALNQDWDLGFKRTDVVMNAPSVGVGQTQGALLYRNENFFGAFGFANYSLLMDAYTQGGELKAFEDVGRLVP